MKAPLILLFAFGGILVAQTVIPNGAPASYRFDGRVNEWTGLAPTFPLHASQPGGRSGSVWIRQIPEGLLIAGRVDGAAPDFAANREEMARKDHVEIWLAPPTQPTFPSIGYGSNSREIPKIGMCGEDQKCRAWFETVLVHRRLMARTFLREYDMSPSVVVENFARPAYERMFASLEKEFKGYIDVLAPRGAPVFRTAPGSAGGYSFEVIVPWDALPPFSSLQLRRMRVMVDVFGRPAGALKRQAYSSTSSVRRYGDPSSFNPVVLNAGRVFRLTACEYPLEVWNPRGKSSPARFFPQREDGVTRVFRLRNFDPYYSYRPSPVVEFTDFIEKRMPGNTIVCGPRLAIARNGIVQRFERDVDQGNLDVKVEPDGSYLVLSGPSWRRADESDEDGCCKGSPMIHFHVWSISPAGKIKEIFEDHVIMSGMAAGVADMQVAVSPDARKITVYASIFPPLEREGHWSSSSYCRKGEAYKACGYHARSAPPKGERKGWRIRNDF